jgi:hypothetical protein
MCAIHGSSGGKLIFHNLMFHTNIWKQPYRSTELFQPIATKEHNTRKWSFELKEAFHFTKTNKDDNSSLYTQIWFHYTSNNSLSAGAPVSQLYLVKLLCYAQKPLEDMHGASDTIN